MLVIEDHEEANVDGEISHLNSQEAEFEITSE
jgi:hypothetical protein